MPDSSAPVLDALVIGAGPAGIGTALALAAVEDLTFGVLERGQVGQTFLDWPEQQTFLTPSFTGNGFGATDLNSVHPRTSPAFSLGVDYPTGREYARYLRSVVKHFGAPILGDTEVSAVTRHDVGFEVTSSRGPVLSRNVVWAGGEHGDPSTPRLAGGSLCDHSSTTEAWQPHEGELVVIGGYESGIDIACHHVEQGARVTVVDASTPWDAGSGSDPSFLLAPRSRIRLERALRTGRLTLRKDRAVGVKVLGGKPHASGSPAGPGFVVRLSGGDAVTSDRRPIAATGYGPGLGPVAQLFDRDEGGHPLLDEDDQSTLTPGLFLAGPAIRHGAMKFCFVYKFRQRFAHVAGVIGATLGKNCAGLEEWRDAGMLTDNLAQCGIECAC